MQITTCGRGVHIREVVGIERLRKLPHDWYGFTNLDLATGRGRSREIDLVLVAEDRIFLIDLKDWNGGIESEGGNWLHNGRDTGRSPVAKIHDNAKVVWQLLTDHLKRHMKGETVPRVVGLVVVTGKADFTGIAETEKGSVFHVDDFSALVSKTGSRLDTFGKVPISSKGLLTEKVWKDQLSKFFNARTGPLVPGRRRYNNFVANSDEATFQHPQKIYSEYEAVDENAAQTLGTLRIWDFTKAETRFQNEEARQEIAGRERNVVEYLKDRSEACENAILHPRAEDPERGVAYWEVFDRRQRLRRLSEFVTSENSHLQKDRRIELARQLVARVAALHSVDAAHLDLGGHSIWLESPSTVKLSHLMAAKFPQVESLGDSRYQFLASATLPEDILGGENIPKRRDVFLLAAAVHWLLFGVQPASSGNEGESMPFEWHPSVDEEAKYGALHSWLETGLSLDPKSRFPDAQAALEAFNAATADRPNDAEVIKGLERFRTAIRSQKHLFQAYSEIESLKESDRVDIWKSEDVSGSPVLVKLWKRAAWGDQTREGPRILDFLSKAQDMALSPVNGSAEIQSAHWLGDAMAIVQRWVDGTVLSDVLVSSGFEGDTIRCLKFCLSLANTVTELHDEGLTHGDLKPQNIIVSGDDSPVLIDTLDFQASDDGEPANTAYSPGGGGRLERDRFAVTRIVEEVMAGSSIEGTPAAAISRSIKECRETEPQNGTLLPLLDALELSLNPQVETPNLRQVKLSFPRVLAGPLLSDEGRYFVRKGGLHRSSFIIRGACEELEVFVDDQLRPVRGHCKTIDQKQIGRLSKFEFMNFEAEIEMLGSANLQVQDLDFLLADQSFLSNWNSTATKGMDAGSVDEVIEAQPEPAFEDSAFDQFSEVAKEPSAPVLHNIDIRRLWQSLIAAEGELTTDGVAAADSGYNRDLDRHIVPFELTSGTFDFNRNDRVGVERLDRKGSWQRIGELDIARSRPDRILIDAAGWAGSASSGLVNEEQRLRFISHFSVQSLKRRESAISRTLAGQARITSLPALFEPRTKAVPKRLDIDVSDEDLARYGLNRDQREAFKKILSVRPLGALQGPPGTGKTLFIAALAHFALTHGLAKNILLASQSHEAVNNAAEAVLRLFANHDEQPSILRVGNEGVVSERLMPFFTDRLEQLYKDRFTAEFRERIRIAGRSLGVPSLVVEAMIDIERNMRPVAETILRLQDENDPDLSRIDSLTETLEVMAAKISGADQANFVGGDPLDVIEQVLDLVVHKMPAGERPAPERVGRMRSVFQLANDFVGSVSTQQRGFEAFLAGTRQIVAGTCVGLGRTSLGLTNTPFDLVIIDEAARCTASELAVPMQSGRWVVLVGDHAQLEPQHPATVASKVAAELSTTELAVIQSDFERLFENNYGKLVGARLKTQYRMLPPIGKVVSEAFYGGELEAGRSDPEIDPEVLPQGLDFPLTWITTDGLGPSGEEKTEASGTSRVNPREADTIVALIKRWATTLEFTDWISNQKKHSHVIGIICMYAAQRDLIRKKIQAANLPEAFRRSIKIDTVDSYQGKENPIVILSLVRNNVTGPAEKGVATIRAGFLKRPNRINVAVSRAMDRLIIVGAKSRWEIGGPVHRLSEAVEAQYRADEAKVISASSLLGEPTKTQGEDQEMAVQE
jgi:serine/threonine protein kinase